MRSLHEQQAIEMRRFAGLDGGSHAAPPAPAQDAFKVLENLLEEVSTGTGQAKLLADLARRAKEARAEEEKQLAAERDRLEVEIKRHDERMALDRAELAKQREAVAALSAAAEKDRAEATALKAELQKRLRAIQAVVNA